MQTVQKKANYNFSKDLKASKASVEKVKQYLLSVGCYDITENHDNKYDLHYTTEGGTDRTCEVKQDLQFEETGNVAIEVQSRGKASGICSSVADKWYYVLGDDIYTCSRVNIVRYLILHYDRFRRIDGGDYNSSIIALLPMSCFKDIFVKI